MYYWAIINKTYNTQSIEYYKADISKYMSLSIKKSLTEIQDPFIEYAIFESWVSCSFFV